MTDVSHTPGPWVVCPGDDLTKPGIDGPNGEAVVWWTTAHEEGISNPHDALLIAAAPDLLSACEALLRFAENSEGEFGIVLGSANSARRAIAKAKGNV